MTVKEVEQYVLNALNKLSTNAGANISKFQIVEAFNAQQMRWVGNCFKRDNLNRTRIDEIQFLLVSKELSPANTSLGYYTVTLPKDYFRYVRSSSVSGDCPIYHHQVKEPDVNNLLMDDNWKPSKEWQETICTVVAGKLRIYADFTINKVHLLYYRFPRSINMNDNYTDVNITPTADVDPELTGDSLYEVLDLTVMALAGRTGDQAMYQISDKSFKEFN